VNKLLPLLALALLFGCRAPDVERELCTEPGPPPSDVDAPTYHADIRPILEGRCVRCHEPGGIGGFSLDSYDAASALAESIREEVVARTMPPFLAADCCQPMVDDFSLTDDEIGRVAAWVDQGAPEGDPADLGEPLPPVGGLSRVDVVVEMDAPYVAAPGVGKADDFRCFLLDWPLDEEVFVTGLEPIPSNRSLVHHLIVAAVEGDDLAEAEQRDRDDPGPGFACSDGLGAFLTATVLGGSLAGGDFPHGLGRRVPPGSKILLNAHYSTVAADGLEEQTAIAFKIDDDGRPMKTLPVANPAWIAGGAQTIPAGEADVVFRHNLDPRFITGKDPVDVVGVTPHLHDFGTQLQVYVVHEDGSTTCLLEIPRWEFGWEQPFWLAEPITLQPGDRVAVECHFDNTQRPGNLEPRDIAWGPDNQDMCAAFVIFTEAE
jgi:hypothetical protein